MTGHRAWRALAGCLTALGMLLAGASAQADEIRVAVASNFHEAAKTLAKRFAASSGHRVVLVPGSTGKHYAQIRHGAPFDAFLAADGARPERLEREGLAHAGERFTYALGQLVLWSPREDYVDAAGAVLANADFRHLAIANPKLAPYGAAARQVLEERGLWQALQVRLVRGENVAQAYQFVASGNAALGFVALSQVERPGQPARGSWWKVPLSSYTPIEQQAVLLSDSAAARGFLTFLQSNEARTIIRAYGYGLPP